MQTIKVEPADSCEDESWIPSENDKSDGDDDATFKSEFKRKYEKFLAMKTLEGHPAVTQAQRKRPVCSTDIKIPKRRVRQKNNKCEICNKLVDNLKRHNSIFHTKERPLFPCNQCNMSCVSKIILQKHIQRVHEKVFSHICGYCGKGEMSNTNLIAHERVHTGERPFCCDMCGKTFYTKTTLNSHKRTHVTERKFECKICGKRYKTLAGKSEHEKAHSEESKIHKCTICERKFMKKSVLKQHLLSHTDVMDFECNECGKLFKKKSSMKIHIETHAQNSIKLCCDICGRSYGSKRAVSRHAMKEHPDCGLFVSCDICGILCVDNQRSLIDHKMRVHP